MLHLRKDYSFEPVQSGVDSALILRGQGNLRKESVLIFRLAEYAFRPGSLALPEG